jgi:D-lactate dehydrogenase
VTLRAQLAEILGADEVLDRPIDLVAHASDASFYRLIPKAVVRPRIVEDVRALFRLSRQERIPMTFRTAGTSLSGQAVTNGLLVDVARHFRRVEVLDGGRKVRVQPGVIGARVNQVLRPYARKMGPDPASINSAMMGGILSNNSSGMCCGVAQNSYHTLDSLTFVLPSGTVVDTADARADEGFREKEPAVAAGLLELRERLVADTALSARIRAKYRAKNTTGYSLNAFLDYERPVEILRHLLIGAEGTLAFIAEAVLNTVPDLPVKYTGLLLFPTVREACAAIVPLGAAGAAALEVMDRAALRSVEMQPGIPASIRGLPEDAAGLLVEFQKESGADLTAVETQVREAVTGLVLLEPARFTHDPAEQAALWRIRSGMFPSVGAVRKSGTTVIIEDVAFPIPALADAVVDLNRLFASHGYDEGIIFGHAKDGNLHFVITQSFRDKAAIEKYARLIDDVVELVVKRYDGALKAEHGTGRNMAPFVETEWGPAAYAVMKRLKRLVDPDGLLNPGVIINPDPRAHLLDLKPMPSVEEEVDKCMECGFCETRCPSRDLTLTPRQRIVVRREMERLRVAGTDGATLAALEKDFPYEGLDTCATDGLCATACPVGIDTGQLTKRFRSAGHSERARGVARFTVRSFSFLERDIRLALRAGAIVSACGGSRVLSAFTRALRSIPGGLGAQVPLWIEPMPAAAKPLPSTSRSDAAAVYFPSCITRTMGALPGEREELSVAEAFVAVAARAGTPLHIPGGAHGRCCGVPYSSKGFLEAHDLAVNRTVAWLWTWSDEGRLPVVVDTSPCTFGLRSPEGLTFENREKLSKMKIFDGVEFFADLLPRVTVERKAGAVALHPVCSLVKMNLTPQLETLARACAESVTVPASAGCCGFAGDRGWLFPELTESATQEEAAEIRASGATELYSSSRTCEIGMTRATGIVARSFIHLLDRATASPSNNVERSRR